MSNSESYESSDDEYGSMCDGISDRISDYERLMFIQWKPGQSFHKESIDTPLTQTFQVPTSDDLQQISQEVSFIFPNANFKIAIPFKDLDTKITDKKKIIIHHKVNPYFPNDSPLQTLKIEGDKITNRYILEQCILQDMECLLDNVYLQKFKHVVDDVYETHMVAL